MSHGIMMMSLRQLHLSNVTSLLLSHWHCLWVCACVCVWVCVCVCVWWVWSVIVCFCWSAAFLTHSTAQQHTHTHTLTHCDTHRGVVLVSRVEAVCGQSGGGGVWTCRWVDHLLFVVFTFFWHHDDITGLSVLVSSLISGLIYSLISLIECKEM